MKQLFLLIILFNTLVLSAQTYPYKDGFSQDAAGQVPAGWGGDTKVFLNHGFNYGKAMAAQINSIFTDQNSITPVIGPLTAHSTLTFYYRIVDQYIYPSTPTTFYTGDSFVTMVSVDGVAYQSVFAITSSNHTPNLNFKQQKVFLGNLVGDTVHVQFTYHFGGTGAAYYVDIDSVAVYNDPFEDVNDVADDMGLAVYPNPCPCGQACNIKLDEAYKTNSMLEVYDATGRKAYSGTPLNAPLANLTTGIYLLRLTSQNKIASRRLVVQ